MYRWFSSLACGLAVTAFALPCSAHFLWIKQVNVGDKLEGFVFFGENPADEAYHFPEKLANIKLWARAADGKRTEVATKQVKSDDRAGLMGPVESDKAPVLEASQQYGIYGSALLVYHAKHLGGTTAKAIESAGTSKDLKLEIVPQLKADEVTLTVLWDGKPRPDAEVVIHMGDKDPIEMKTGDNGQLAFKPEGGGLVGVLANTMDKKQAGTLDGKTYNGVLHYASLTFIRPGTGEAAEKEAPAPQKKSTSDTAKSASILPPLPEPVASFGAVVADGWLYVYGGHTGGEREHSAANLSHHFRRIQLENGKEWQELPMQTPLQGLPLVAHDGKIYRVGGLNIRNAKPEDAEDLHSTDEFAEFDPSTRKSDRIAPLPAARSSHNSAVIGDRLYVVGGWRLDGKSPGTWQPDALVYDFARPKDGWQKLPLPEFKRRALATGTWKGKLVALGGMDEKNKTSLRVDLFDPQTGKWEQGPKLPGSGMAGFGVSAWNLDGDLYVCGVRGVLYRLSDTGSAWEEAGRLETPRFFHQLVPGTQKSLLAVAGASMDRHLATIEQIDVKSHRVVKNNGAKKPL